MENINDILALISLVGSLWIIKRSKTIGSNQEPSLRKDEKIYTWIFSFCNPIITSVVFYLGWKKTSRTKLKEAAKIAAIVLLIELVIGISLIYLGIIEIPL